LKINLSGIVIIVGNYGSGKTEVAVNLAVTRKNDGLMVRIGDLDLVNPYFRTREARVQLRELGIDVVLPDEKYMDADLPILSPAIYGMIQNPADLNILDAGGDDVGATVLAALEGVISDNRIEVLQVINPYRPFTDTLEGCLKIRDEIEKKSKQQITGVIGNANLIDETKPENVYYGHDFVRDYSEKSGLELAFITVDETLIPDINMDRITCPVLPVARQLVPPWKKSMKIGPENFRIGGTV